MNKSVIFLPILLLLLLSIPCASASPIIYFRSSYETGDLSEWDSTAIWGCAGSGPTSLVITNDLANDGIYSSKATCSCQSATAMAIKNFVPEMDKIYVSIDVLFESIPNGINLAPIAIKSPTGVTITTAVVRENVLGVSYVDQNGYKWTTQPMNISSNKWYRLELMAQVGSDTGQVELYLDNEPIIQLDGLDNTLFDGTPIVGVGSVWVGCAGAPGVLYTDLALMSNEHIERFVPEFSSSTILLLFILFTLIAAALAKTRLRAKIKATECAAISVSTKANFFCLFIASTRALDYFLSNFLQLSSETGKNVVDIFKVQR